MAVIGSDTKISLKDVAFVVAFSMWLGSIQSSIRDLETKIDGKLNLYEWRLKECEAAKIPAPAAVLPKQTTWKDLQANK